MSKLPSARVSQPGLRRRRPQPDLIPAAQRPIMQHAPTALTPTTLVSLQRQIGNRAVARLIQRKTRSFSKRTKLGYVHGKGKEYAQLATQIEREGVNDLIVQRYELIAEAYNELDETMRTYNAIPDDSTDYEAQLAVLAQVKAGITHVYNMLDQAIKLDRVNPYDRRNEAFSEEEDERGANYRQYDITAEEQAMRDVRLRRKRRLPRVISLREMAANMRRARLAADAVGPLFGSSPLRKLYKSVEREEARVRRQQ